MSNHKYEGFLPVSDNYDISYMDEDIFEEAEEEDEDEFIFEEEEDNEEVDPYYD